MRLMLVVMLLLTAVPVVAAYNVSETLYGYRIVMNESELPLSIPFNRTIEPGVYNVSLGDFVDALSFVNTSNSSYNYSWDVVLPVLGPNFYDSHIIFDSGNDTVSLIFEITVRQDVDEEVFELPEDFVNISVNEFVRTVYDIELPYEETISVVFGSPEGEVVLIDCSQWFDCPDSVNASASVTTLPVTLKIPNNVALTEYEEFIDLRRGDKTGRVSYYVTLEKAPVDVRIIKEYEYEQFNFTNLTGEQLYEFYRQFSDLVEDSVNLVEEANRPIIEERIVEIEKSKYVPVTQVTEELLSLQDVKTEFIEEQSRLASMRTDLEAERLRLAAQVRNMSDTIKRMQTDAAAMPTPAQLRAQAKEELEAERKLPTWVRRTLLWVLFIGLFSMFAIIVLRLKAQR